MVPEFMARMKHLALGTLLIAGAGVCTGAGSTVLGVSIYRRLHTPQAVQVETPEKPQPPVTVQTETPKKSWCEALPQVDDPCAMRVTDIVHAKQTVEQKPELLRICAIADKMTGSALPNPETLKHGIEANYVQVNGGGGLLLSSDGYFITANHVAEAQQDIIVRRGKETWNAKWLAKSEDRDAALCKAEMRGEQKFDVADIRFAPLERIQPGALVEVIGQVNGKLYWQVGKIVHTDANAPIKGEGGKPGRTYLSTVVISAYAEPGFSGGPVVLKETGELIGFMSYSHDKHEYSGVARIDHFASLFTAYAKRLRDW